MNDELTTLGSFTYINRDVARQNMENALIDLKEAETASQRKTARRDAKRSLNLLMDYIEDITKMERDALTDGQDD